MKTLMLIGCSLLIAGWFGSIHGQLIIDEDDPTGHKIIELILNAINKQENGNFVLKRLVYTLGEDPNYRVDLIVENTANHAQLVCLVELFVKEKNKFSTGQVRCKPNPN